MDFLKWLFTSAVVAISGIFGAHPAPAIVQTSTDTDVVVEQRTLNENNNVAEVDSSTSSATPKIAATSPAPSRSASSNVESKLYTSKEMGVSFNHPKTWKAEYKKNRDGKAHILLTSPDFALGQELKGEMITIEFGASWIAGSQSENTTAQEYVNQKIDFYTKNPLTKGVILQVSFKNQPAFLKRTLTTPGIAAAWTIYNGREFSVTYMYPEWGAAQENLFDQLISSLVLLPPATATTETVSNNPADTSALHYRNSTLGIAFDYPATWLVTSEKDAYGKETVILKTPDYQQSSPSITGSGSQFAFSFSSESTPMASGNAETWAKIRLDNMEGTYDEKKIVRLGTQYAAFLRWDGIISIQSAFNSIPLTISGRFATWSPDLEKTVSQLISTFSFE